MRNQRCGCVLPDRSIVVGQ